MIDGIQMLNQGLAAFAGLFGRLSVSFFWQAKTLHQCGRLAAGVIISH
ncbi:hypothetical protein [Kosakonia oryziphila]|uniref:Uncharacterized protein n=1 Tax=Kosakonia oryziphila TaxID=1005667 RepID=A0A1C4DER8_9ENTR|nr:hypothetical protein [Kosakonia oryziphila]SCC29816.1 hypothetical protein GA0061070_10167 [Kosakonia oryziphila]